MKKTKKISTVTVNNPKTNSKKPNEIKITGTPSNENIIFDISEFQFKSVKMDSFTNFLKDSNEFSQYIDDLFHKMIPEIHKKKFSEISNKSYNYHPIQGENLILTKKILNTYGIQLQDDEEENLLQFSSGTGGVRFVGRRLGNIFKLYFLDFHHLIYPNIKYNIPDYKKNDFCILKLKQ